MSLALHRIGSAADASTPSLAKVGQWILARPIQTLSHSAEEIARLTETSVAAVNRFSKAAGFSGYSHLKSVLAQELQSAVDPIRKISGQLRDRRSAARQTQGEALEEAVHAPEIRRVAARLLKARQVWLLGMGASSHLAGYAMHVLMPYLTNVAVVAVQGGTEEAARRLLRCGSKDVLVAFSLPRYSRDTVRLATFAKTRGTHVVAITDTQQAPIAAQADQLLLAPSWHPVMSSSALGALAVVESLAANVMRLNPDALRITNALSEAVLPHLAPPVER